MKSNPGISRSYQVSFAIISCFLTAFLVDSSYNSPFLYRSAFHHLHFFFTSNIIFALIYLRFSSCFPRYFPPQFCLEVKARSDLL